MTKKLSRRKAAAKYLPSYHGSRADLRYYAAGHQESAEPGEWGEEMMGRYVVSQYFNNAMVFRVDAASPEEALQKHADGESEWVGDEPIGFDTVPFLANISEIVAPGEFRTIQEWGYGEKEAG
jgi:hypothetical protein